MTTHEYNPDEHEPMPEGEEKAPPLTHTMAIVRWVLLAGLTLFALVMVLSYFNLTPWAQSKQSATRYHCPMHPTYISNQPGDCPICGMTLVAMTNTADTVATSESQHMSSDSIPKAKTGQYTCPMHPEVISDTSGKCPKCGMDLVPVITSDTVTQSSQPMNNDVMSMTSSVPGLVPVTVEPGRLQLIGLRTGSVEMRSFGETKHFPGYIVPDETRMATITSRVNGWVQKLLVNQTGQEVNKGETLFTLYSQDLYQAEQDFLTATHSTKKAAFDSFLADTRQELVNAAKKRLQLLGLSDNEIARLEKSDSASAEISIVSPVTGIVLTKNILSGQTIMPDQTLFTVADLTRIWVEVEVYESDLAGIELGQDAVMTLPSFPGDQFHGSVTFIYPTVSDQTRTLKVRLQFQNPVLKLKPGMFADVQLAGGTDSALSIPRDALMQDGDKDYVFVVHDVTHFQPRLVTVGKTSNDFVEITTGLSPGETIVTSANFLIDSESRLKAAMVGMGNTDTSAHAGHGM